MSKTKQIPVFDLDARAKAGFFMKPLGSSLNRTNHDIKSAHRDNSYMLCILKEGFCRFMIDFETLVFEGPMCCLIHPDQVHGWLEASTLDGWMIAFDPNLLTQESLPLISQLGCLSISDAQAEPFVLLNRLADLLWQTFQSDGQLVDQPLTLRFLLNAILTMVASLGQAGRPLTNTRVSRGDEITAEFRQLISANFSTWKRPAQYAQQLNVSVNHLNDMVKAKTGYSVSYWIQYQTMLEAKRQLYHTQQTVKEIAYQLGFDDQHYFSRMFHKVTSQTPVAFRQSFRDLFTRSPL